MVTTKSIPITPIKDYVVATEIEAKAKTASGIFLPQGAQERTKVLRVVAVGKAVQSVKVNDQIVFKSYSQTDIKVEGTDYALIAEEDIIATVKT